MGERPRRTFEVNKMMGWNLDGGAWLGMGFGMLLGLVVFVLGRSSLRGAGEAPAKISRNKEFSLYGVGIGAVAVIWALIQYQDVIQTLLIVSGLGLLG